MAGINNDGEFREVRWSQLSFNERLKACQQLEDRLAAERGAAPRKIIPLAMDDATFGYQQRDRIYINSYLLEQNRFKTENGFVEVPAAGWQVYDTICHEDMHGMQEDLKIGQTFTYISPEKHYDLYRIQYDEKYAYAVAQDRTLSAIIQQKNLHGLEDDMIDYKNQVKQDRYQDRVEAAGHNYGIPNIDQELDRLLQDKEQGIVSDSPSPGYQKLDHLLYGTKLSFLQEDEGESEAGFHSASTKPSLSYQSLVKPTQTYVVEEYVQRMSYEEFVRHEAYGKTEVEETKDWHH